MINLRTKEVVIDQSVPDEVVEQFNQREILISHQEEIVASSEQSYLTQDLDESLQKQAVSLLVSYLTTTQKRSLAHIQRAVAYEHLTF